ncbi:protein phosphatase 2C domain-containing protein [Nocardioides sp. YIM 152588]|uniref:protein phosphatase 2C domain-containing protein n=1 Tax=Nocardioides sp. YIM 152588 TaxID=3158259 RepID=UPI0032E4B79A
MTPGGLGAERPQPDDDGVRHDLARHAATTAPRPDADAWTALAASTIGSVHVRDRRPLQDAALTWSEGDLAVAAVADGHGHVAHFRSDTGAALAVVSAIEVVRRGLPDLAGPALDAERASARLFDLGAEVVATWVAGVRQHLAVNPYRGGEVEAAAHDPLLPYGSTLVVAGAVGDRLVLLQIGDGDAVVVTADGHARRPLPEDPAGDGLRTSSLCQPEPLRALRVAVVDTAAAEPGAEVVLAFLCTDGFGSSRVDAEGWWRQTGEQLVDYTRTRGIGWVADQLGTWLEEPALIGGDDTTLAVLVRSDLGA